MGVINFEQEPYYLQTIKRRLRTRMLEPDIDEEWEVHGPHRDMEYPVYVGWARLIGYPNDYVCVAIYPRAVYRIDGPNDWYKVTPDDRICQIPKGQSLTRDYLCRVIGIPRHGD